MKTTPGAYIRAVAKAIGVGVNDPLIVAQRHVMAPLVKAIIQHENGRQPYSDELIDRALDMAGHADMNSTSIGGSSIRRAGTL